MKDLSFADIQPVELKNEYGKPAKVAIIHDLLTQHGGAEVTLDVLHKLFPQAPIFTLVHDKSVMGDRYKTADIRTSRLQTWPLGVRKYQWYLKFMPSLVEQYRLFEYDVVISSASAYAKGVLTRPDTLHVSYCHSPTRYLWSDTHEYVDDLSLPKPIRQVLKLTLTKLRTWDYAAAQRPNVMIANSRTVQKRIAHYYDRDVEIIKPPVVLDGIQYDPAAALDEPFYLIVGRLRPHKRFDIAIQACEQLGVKLKIAGEGDDLSRLKSFAGEQTEFLGRVSNQERSRLLSTCRAFLQPQYEDYGMTPIEAMAAGAPVIAYGKGGTLETVKSGITGEFFEEQTVESMMQAIKRFDPLSYSREVITSHAQTLGLRPFVDSFTRAVQVAWAQHDR